MTEQIILIALGIATAFLVCLAGGLHDALQRANATKKHLLEGINSRAKDCSYLISRAEKLEREIDRLNGNQNGYRHPRTGVFVKKSAYYKAVLK